MKTFTAIKRFPFYLCLGAVWLFLCTINSFLNQPEIAAVHFRNELWQTVYLAVVNFLFIEYSLPFLLKKRAVLFFNILIGVLLIAVQFALVSFGLYGWRNLGVWLDIYTPLRQSNLIPNDAYAVMLEEVFYQAESGLASLFFFGIVKHVYDYRKLMAVAQQLRLEKQEAELNYLKSQTNPHFLFNTLNNIYSLARDKSDLAPESILRLSKILRFMLYETGGAFITIEQEQEIISDYIALEKLRYDDTLRISFGHEIEDTRQLLPPLLLMPLVENAFKHGSSEASKQSFVDIELSVKVQQLLFVVRNSTESFQGEKKVKENIGLSNLRRQLELLYTDYKLTVQQDAMVFTATLKINLGSHV
jgi:two-component system LytT family sensor kinase